MILSKCFRISDGKCGQRMKVSARPLQMVYDAQTIIKIVEVFKIPPESSALSQCVKLFIEKIKVGVIHRNYYVALSSNDLVSDQNADSRSVSAIKEFFQFKHTVSCNRKLKRIYNRYLMMSFKLEKKKLNGADWPFNGNVILEFL